jgi:hypothetical protein
VSPEPGWASPSVLGATVGIVLAALGVSLALLLRDVGLSKTTCSVDLRDARAESVLEQCLNRTQKAAQRLPWEALGLVGGGALLGAAVVRRRRGRRARQASEGRR